jgi:hypothetical protein
MNFNKRKSFIWLLVFIFLIAAPIILEFSLSSKYKNLLQFSDGWLGLFGSYFGAIIGAMTTLIAVSIQIKDNTKNRLQDQILNIRPYLHMKVLACEPEGDRTKIVAEIENMGLHSACDIWIYEVDDDHPDSNKYLFSHGSACAGEGEKVELLFDFQKTCYYKFSFYDLKSNRYEQEFRYSTDSKKFFSLEPKIYKYYWE